MYVLRRIRYLSTTYWLIRYGSMCFVCTGLLVSHKLNVVSGPYSPHSTDEKAEMQRMQTFYSRPHYQVRSQDWTRQMDSRIWVLCNIWMVFSMLTGHSDYLICYILCLTQPPNYWIQDHDCIELLPHLQRWFFYIRCRK